MEYTKETLVDDRFILPSPRGIQCVHDFHDLPTGRKQVVNLHAEMSTDTIEMSLVGQLIDVGTHRPFVAAESGVDPVLIRWDRGTNAADNNEALREVGVAPHQIKHRSAAGDSPAVVTLWLSDGPERFRVTLGYCGDDRHAHARETVSPPAGAAGEEITARPMPTAELLSDDRLVADANAGDES